MDASRGRRSQIGDHFVIELETQCRPGWGTQQGCAREELPNGHCQAIRQARDVGTGRPAGQNGRHHRRRWQGEVDPFPYHVGAGCMVAEPFALAAYQPADQSGYPQQQPDLHKSDECTGQGLAEADRPCIVADSP